MLKIPFLSDEQDLVCSEGFQTLFRYIRDIAQLLSISYVPVPIQIVRSFVSQDIFFSI